jgi:hypothetical protein
LESNPSVKEAYKALLKREWNGYRNEDNPLVTALNYVCGNEKDSSFIQRALALYPENRRGFGEEYWAENGRMIAERWGGGEFDGYAREPLPVSHRPKDSFLWQRNARRLEGDFENRYPATDYLFVYWFCRAQGILAAGEEAPNVRQR